jgi:aromatic ring-opening dioxygenase LigB subunit
VAGLVFGCIAPHGSDVIAELSGDDAWRTATTRDAMEELGRRMVSAQPETVIVITPHGVRVAGAVCVMTTERASGMLESDGGHDQGHGRARVEVDMAVDTELGKRIAERAARVYGVPAAATIYGASSGQGCYTPLDWGAVVPLWYLGARWSAQPAMLSMTPSRALSLRQLYDFGTSLAEVSVESGRRVALVASADWGHAHDPSGPYGFDPASAEFDAMAQEIISNDDLDRFLAVDLHFAERAMVDGLWQAVMLAGALHHTPMRGELLSYQVHGYFGMLVAAYEPR